MRYIFAKFNFDFVRLMESKFSIDPFDARCPKPMEIEVYHSDEQRELIQGYVNQYGTTLIGLGRILIRANLNRFYRSARWTEGGDSLSAQEPVLDSIRSHHHLIT